MHHRRLGHSGLWVSEIAYGTWLTNDEASIRAALDLGVTTFDTADAYEGGRSEELLGRVLRAERREELVILTKAFWPTGPGPNERGLSRKHLREAIDGSLRRLNVDYVDVFQAHRFDPVTPLEETMLAFADIVRSGKALYIGVSEWSAEQLRAGAELARELRVPLISHQPQYSLLWRAIEAEIVPVCAELGLGQIVFSPLAQGVLTGKYRPGEPPPPGSRATDAEGSSNTAFRRFIGDDVLSAVCRLHPIAARAGLTVPQLAIAWVLRNPAVASAIVGASRPDHLRENVKASGVRLEQPLLDAIDEALTVPQISLQKRM
jgi:aryl-alcohol dehydrogenase-like predicted oxidoreductase